MRERRDPRTHVKRLIEALPQLSEDLLALMLQMNQDRGKRAALWGMDQRGTREAAELFAKDGLLDRFLELVWPRPA